jgi:thioredoxin 1
VSAPAPLDGPGFAREVLAADVPVLVDFWAPWCVPCRKVAPLVRELGERNAGRLRVASVNVDEQPAVASAYDVLSLPTVILFVGGAPVERLAGAVKPARLEKTVTPYLPA